MISFLQRLGMNASYDDGLGLIVVIRRFQRIYISLSLSCEDFTITSKFGRLELGDISVNNLLCRRAPPKKREYLGSFPI